MAFVVLFLVYIDEGVFQVVAVDLWDKIWVVLYEVYQEIWHIVAPFMRDQYIQITVLLHIFG